LFSQPLDHESDTLSPVDGWAWTGALLVAWGLFQRLVRRRSPREILGSLGELATLRALPWPGWRDPMVRVLLLYALLGGLGWLMQIEVLGSRAAWANASSGVTPAERARCFERQSWPADRAACPYGGRYLPDRTGVRPRCTLHGSLTEGRER